MTDAREPAPQRNAFTLIELLVVISIIALLISILLPALSRARFVAKEVACLTGMRQLGMGMLSYEVDEGRLPAHVAEGYNTLYPTMIAANPNPGSDRRPLYEPYVSVNFFQCPFYEPRWDWSTDQIASGTARLYTPYLIGPGYYRDHKTTGGWVADADAWVRSQDFWTYDPTGTRFSVLLGDQLMRDTGTGMTRVNHPGSRHAFDMVNHLKPTSSSYAGSYYQGYFTNDVRNGYTANFIFADGSGVNLRGDDERMQDVPTIAASTTTYLLPRR